jgi:hypothetical protein
MTDHGTKTWTIGDADYEVDVVRFRPQLGVLWGSNDGDAGEVELSDIVRVYRRGEGSLVNRFQPDYVTYQTFLRELAVERGDLTDETTSFVEVLRELDSYVHDQAYQHEAMIHADAAEETHDE